ncbi:PAS domain-containing sensor histidine kinase [Pedobacter paludis]|uniref:histidine kinase n=1 Tax=Pedobacter paludis TaxID=2203212 RepID=A0A317EUJ6_9SPHI|nr:ATP-binding protein [Pedobacter paludis]PWS30384.1 hypothetical protein DF947_18335 [Pedobacter paludis]
MEKSKEHIALEQAFSQLKAELEEANDVIHAIRTGEIDALVVKGSEGHQLFTLKSADHTYRIFIEQMSEGALTLDKFDNILYSNSQFAKLLGIPLEKVIGMNFSALVTHEDRSFAMEVVGGAWDVDTRAELRLENYVGEKISVQISLKALELDEGKSLSVILTDLTALKKSQSQLEIQNKELEIARQIAEELNSNLEATVKARTQELESNIRDKVRVEEVLRSNEQRLTSILHTMGEGLCILDTIGQVTFANPRAQKIFALSAEEILLRDYFTLQSECFSLDGSTLQREQHPIYIMSVNQKPVYDHEIMIRNHKDESVYISINASPLYDGEIFIGVVMTFTDVTNRRKIAFQKDEFISVASHEIKTPLTSLKASMQLLTRVMETNLGSEKIPMLIQKANSNLAKVVHLADDLMNVSKIQHGPLPLNLEETNMASLVISCAEQILNHTPVKLVIEGEMELSVLVDQQRIEQVLVNLFNNALKYASESKIIKVIISQGEKFAKVSVQDFGAGIPPEKLAHLFDRYYQVDPQGKQVSGLGLGLYISHEIIQRHGGELTVESTFDFGSTFSFTVPTRNNL